MKLTKIILITIIFSLFTLHVSALTFANFTSGGTGTINTGNGYFDDPQITFGYSDSRNVYLVTEDNESVLVEPISYTTGVSPPTFTLINASSHTLTDAVVHNGYVYFVDGTTLKKRKTRNMQTTCEANDTSAGGCILTIQTGVSPYLRVYNHNLYYFVGTALKTLDSNDNQVAVFSGTTLTNVRTGWTVTSNSSTLTLWEGGRNTAGGSHSLYRCTSVSCVEVIRYTEALVTLTGSMFTTASYEYFFQYNSGVSTHEFLLYNLNSSQLAVDYITSDLGQNNRIYIGGLSTVGLLASSTTVYATFNSNEVGIDSLPLSEGSGIVDYVNKEINVPNTNYYNDSTIPINVNLKFIISDTNHTNYLTSATWHLLAFDPTGVQVEDHDLPIVCTQTQPWWDPFGVLSLFLVDLVTPWACDGTQTVQYSPNPGQFWMNGTWTIELTEQIPGTTSVLSTDTYNIVNQSSTGSGVVNPPAPCPTCGLGKGGTINTNTSLQIIQVFSMIAFWGFIIWLGIVGSIIGVMAKSPSGVNGMAVIVVAWLSAVFIALIGLFDPFKIYVIVLSTIIAAVLFRLGKNATTTED